MDKIGVIVPVYKVEAYLNRCIESILRQTYTNFELVLVDDGSPDNCPSICDEYAQKDARIHVIHKFNGGLSSARNAGIEYVLQKEDICWITFIDSDDWVHEQYLETLYRAVASHKVEISACDFLQTRGEIDAKLEFKGKIKFLEAEKFWVNARMRATTAWGKLYQKSIFQDIRYPEGKIHEDEYVTYRLLFTQKKVAYNDAKLYYYYQREDSIIHQKWSIKKLDAYQALLEQLQFFKDNNFRKAYKGRVIAQGTVLFDLLSDAKKSLSKEEYDKVFDKLQASLKEILVKYKRHYPMGKCYEAWLLAFPEKEKQIMRRRNIRVKIKNLAIKLGLKRGEK